MTALLEHFDLAEVNHIIMTSLVYPALCPVCEMPQNLLIDHMYSVRISKSYVTNGIRILNNFIDVDKIAYIDFSSPEEETKDSKSKFVFCN